MAKKRSRPAGRICVFSRMLGAGFHHFFLLVRIKIKKMTQSSENRSQKKGQNYQIPKI
jgi:hypothetical protein